MPLDNILRAKAQYIRVRTRDFGTLKCIDEQMSLINALAATCSSCLAGGLNFGMSLHRYPYLLYMSSEGSGEKGLIDAKWFNF